MILLAGGSALRKRFGAEPWLGQLICPRSRNRVTAARWAADNASFSSFDPNAYLAMVFRIAKEPTRPLFLTVPDAVADAWQTMALWEMWSRILRPFRLPLAYVVQDGVESIGIPWEDISAIFIGGSTEFKIGSVARRAVALARQRRIWVHMGRVNTVRRLIYAQQIGCDSVDGSGFAKFPDQMISRFTRVNANRVFGELGDSPA
jgi:hypothetical protein